MIRGPFSHEPGRLECVLLGMQGLGGPGVHQCQLTYFGMPRAEGLKSVRFFNPQLSERLRIPAGPPSTPGESSSSPRPSSRTPSSSRRSPSWAAAGRSRGTEDQFIKYTYPIAKEKGGTEIHMIWTDTPCRITCWNHGNWTIEAYPTAPRSSASSPSIPGWRTTASMPTSSCRPTPPWRWRTSSPTPGRVRTSRASPSRSRPSRPSASRRATTRSSWRWPRSWGWSEQFTRGQDHQGPGERGL